MLTLFDTHAHLLDEQFNDMRNTFLPALPNMGIGGVVEVCCDVDDMPKIAALSMLYDHVYGSVGVHPQSAGTLTPSVVSRMAYMLSFPKIVAVGEIGLDYHYEYFPREVQKAAFAQQVELAQTYHKPIIVHDREAHGDCMELLQAHREGLRGVMHCYSGSYEDAVRYIDMGMYIAFGGALTFKNASRLRDVAARLPLERIVVETDCPYMTPEPDRGTRNDPTHLHFTVETLAKVRGMDPNVLAAVTTENARRLYRV